MLFAVSDSVSSSNILLQSLKVKSTVENSLSTLIINQEFKNMSSSSLECEYRFPVLAEAVVTDVNIILPDGSILKSKINKEDEAKEIYQDALSQGNSAYLSKQEDSKSMTIHIGNIRPSEALQIEIAIVSPLIVEDKFWKLIIPTDFIPYEHFSNSLTNSFKFEIEINSSEPISEYRSN